MGLMAEKKQGCIRFHWNRDWNIRDFQTVEDALNLKKSWTKVKSLGKFGLLANNTTSASSDSSESENTRTKSRSKKIRKNKFSNKSAMNSSESQNPGNKSNVE